ncbi:MAG: isopentenyl phosphate kinase [Candidatus Altiarchaeota archaeon]
MQEILVLKLGGSVITKKSQNKREVNEKILKRIAKEISEAKTKRNFSLVVVHGAGAFGHVPAKKYKLNEGLKNFDKQIKGIAETHKFMEELNFRVVEALQNAKLNAIAFQPSASGVLENGKLVSFQLRILKNFLQLGIIPVLYGDVLLDRKKGIGILSGDYLVSYIAKKLNAKKVILCTDVNGVYTSDPKKDKNAKLIKKIGKVNVNEIKKLGSSTSTDVTGGMKRKIEELLKISKKGMKIKLINGFKKGLLKRELIKGDAYGTIVD